MVWAKVGFANHLAIIVCHILGEVGTERKKYPNNTPLHCVAESCYSIFNNHPRSKEHN